MANCQFLSFLILCGFCGVLKGSIPDVKLLGDFKNLHGSLYKETASANIEKNLIFSPFSIQLCLTLAHTGANGRTADEIFETIGLSSTFNARNISNVLVKNKHDVILHVANKAYVKSGYNLRPEYQTSIMDDLKSDVESIDFGRSEEAADAINHWIEEQTNHKIKNMVNPGSIDDMTRFLLVNAVYFHAFWMKYFGHIHPGNFTNLDSTVSTVAMMKTRFMFKVGQINELSSHVVKLPYQKTNIAMLDDEYMEPPQYLKTPIAMFLIIPDDVQGLTKLEENVNHLNFHTIDSQMKESEVTLHLPKFDIELELNLKEILKKMGIVEAFGDDADFSKMLVSNKPLYISKILHKAFIKVDEEGTEAGVSTYGMGSNRIAFSRGKIELKADHPFMFAIVSEDIETPLFIGAIKHLNSIKECHGSKRKCNSQN